ncbi:hypothetical protein [Allgaiera indica]|nr:hypothetical protein [Allgaiera indica]
MSPEDELLNLTDEEEGDAYAAWAILATHLDVLPDDARRYFERLCAKIDEFDPREDVEVALTNDLATPVIRSKARKALGKKSPHDYAHVFDWVTAWMKTEGVGIEKAFWDYIEVHDLQPDQFDTIKFAYHKVRRVRLASM